jgi:thiol-disulfide isomerase/thioredoxin
MVFIWLAWCGATWAAEGDTPPAQEEAKPSSEPPAKPDPFKVPDGTPEELLQYVEDLANERPTATTFEAMSDFRRKLGAAVLEASNKILAGQPDDDQAQEAVRLKMSALSILASLKDEKAADQLKQFPAELAKAGKKELARIAEGMLLQNELRQAAAFDAEQLKTLIDRVKKHLADGPLDPAAIRLAMNLAQSVEQSGEDKLAAATYRDMAKVLATSDDEDIAELVKTMEGSARRLDLVGNKMLLTGKTLDGKDFQWDDYRGKVVLVDFWATWCGPCRAMLPRLVELHEQYRDRGFDIVGINLDDEAEAVESFLKENELPWTTLFDSHEDAEQAMGQYYGIRVIPTTVLVGKDGKVLATGLHGEAITAAVTDLLGPPPEEEKKPAETPEKPAAEKSEA